MKVIKTDVPEKIAGREINALLEKYIDEEILLLLSGGSSFRILNHIDTSLINERVTIGVLDERFSEGNNFEKLSKTDFYLKTQSAKYIDTSKYDSKEELQENWGNELKDLLSKDVKVIATLGMGTDGHTAGIFPGYEMPESLTHVYTVEGNEYPERVTTTPAFLKMIDHSVVFVTGEEKREAFENLESKVANIWNEMKDVVVVTDLV